MKKSGVISPASIFKFGSEPDRYSSHKMVWTISVGWCAKLMTIADVHDFGCRVAAKMNAYKESQKSRPLKRPGETEHYRGSYWLSVGGISEIPTEVSAISVDDWPEEGLAEHANIVLRPRFDDLADEAGLAEDRTAVIAGLRELARDPQSYICPCDLDLRAKLEEVPLLAGA
jgi:hypothetical protein